jgi:hypothetical protein
MSSLVKNMHSKIAAWLYCSVSYLITALLAAILTVFVYKHRWFSVGGLPKNITALALALKFMAGVVLTLLYTHYYTERQNSDIYKYYDDGIELNKIYHQSPGTFFQIFFERDLEEPVTRQALTGINNWDAKIKTGIYNDNRILIKINAVLAFVSGRNIFFHTIVAAFIGFVGLIAFIKTFEKISNTMLQGFTLLILFFPSIMLWTAAMMKETMLVFFFGFFLLSAYHFAVTRKWWLLFPIAFLLLLLVLLKVYVSACLIPCLLIYLATTHYKKDSGRIWLTAITGLAITGLLADRLLLQGRLMESLAEKQFHSINLAHYMKAGSIVYIPILSKDSIVSFLLAAPAGLFNCLFRPTLFDISSPLLVPAALENLLLVILIVYTLFKPAQRNNLWWGCCCFSMLLFIIIGITTPVMGSLVRYRVPALMAFLFLLNVPDVSFILKHFIKRES